MPTLSTKAAVYSGLISSEAPVVGASCETANCSWPLVPTLSACGECVTLPYVYGCNETARTCTYSTVSGGLAIEDATDSAEHGVFKVSPSNGSAHPLGSTSRAYFSVFDTLALTRSADAGVTVKAHECALWFCVQAYAISVREGKQTQSIAGNWSTVAVVHEREEEEEGEGGSEYVFVNMPDDLNVVNGTRYAVTRRAMAALRGLMADITAGALSVDANALGYSSDWVEAIWDATAASGISGGSGGISGGGGKGLHDWIANFAQTMAAEIRRRGSAEAASQTVYRGSAVEMAPFIRVRWVWMLYPTVMVVLSVGYLVGTMVASARDRVAVWKGDVLPMLFCRVDGEIMRRAGDAMEVPGGLEDKVSRIRVALAREEDGRWAFRMVEEEEGEEDVEDVERGENVEK